MSATWSLTWRRRPARPAISSRLDMDTKIPVGRRATVGVWAVMAQDTGAVEGPATWGRTTAGKGLLKSESLCKSCTKGNSRRIQAGTSLGCLNDGGGSGEPTASRQSTKVLRNENLKGALVLLCRESPPKNRPATVTKVIHHNGYRNH